MEVIRFPLFLQMNNHMDIGWIRKPINWCRIKTPMFYWPSLHSLRGILEALTTVQVLGHISSKMGSRERRVLLGRKIHNVKISTYSGNKESNNFGCKAKCLGGSKKSIKAKIKNGKKRAMLLSLNKVNFSPKNPLIEGSSC